MAAHLGLTNTHYADPSGLEPGQRVVGLRSLAPDRVCVVGRAARRRSCAPRHTRCTRASARFQIHSTNKLLGTDVDVRAGKTGFISKAGYCLATLLQVPQGSQVAVVVLGAANSTTRFWEARHLFNWVGGPRAGHRRRRSVRAPTNPRDQTRPSRPGFERAVNWPLVDACPRGRLAYRRRDAQIAGRAPTLHVLMVASEVTPWAKTGGLGGRARRAARGARSARPSDDAVVLPRYRGVSRRRGDRAVRARASWARRPRDVSLSCGERSRRAGGLSSSIRRSCSIATASTTQGGVDFPDNAERFALLAAAALDFAHAGGASAWPDVIHAHDWQAGLVPVLVRAIRTAGRRSRRPGWSSRSTTSRIRACSRATSCRRWDCRGASSRWTRASSGGSSAFSRRASPTATSSRPSARPMPARRNGGVRCGLEGVLAARRDRYVGILNGIDTAVWDPATDPYLPASYSTRTIWPARPRASAPCSSASSCRSGDDAMARPVIGMVSRLVDQKGLDLIEAAADTLATLDATWVFVGTRRGALRAVSGEPGRAVSVARRRAHRLRRSARAPGRRRARTSS